MKNKKTITKKKKVVKSKVVPRMWELRINQVAGPVHKVYGLFKVEVVVDLLKMNKVLSAFGLANVKE